MSTPMGVDIRHPYFCHKLSVEALLAVWRAHPTDWKTNCPISGFWNRTPIARLCSSGVATESWHSSAVMKAVAP